MALRNVSFKVDEGELLGVIGPNGAGKTTLFNVITGYLKPDGGSIFFCGEKIDGCEPYEIAKKGIARTFQLVKPFKGMNVIENVLVAYYATGRVKGKKTAQAVEKHLREVDLIQKKYKLASELPHGDLKRLEIARALALNPKLLLLDEPFSGLTVEEIRPIL